MTKTEMKEIAKNTLRTSIGTAYCKISDEINEYTNGEKEQIIQYINKYGEAACKAFGKEYVTY